MTSRWIYWDENVIFNETLWTKYWQTIMKTINWLCALDCIKFKQIFQLRFTSPCAHPSEGCPIPSMKGYSRTCYRKLHTCKWLWVYKVNFQWNSANVKKTKSFKSKWLIFFQTDVYPASSLPNLTGKTRRSDNTQNQQMWRLTSWFLCLPKVCITTCSIQFSWRRKERTRRLGESYCL